MLRLTSNPSHLKSYTLDNTCLQILTTIVTLLVGECASFLQETADYRNEKHTRKIYCINFRTDRLESSRVLNLNGTFMLVCRLCNEKQPIIQVQSRLELGSQ